MPSLLHTAARHEAGHAIIAELFAGMHGITTPVIRHVEAFPNGVGGVQYVWPPDVPDALKPRLCLSNTHKLLQSGSTFIWDAACDFRIATSQDAYNHHLSALHEKTLAIVARDIVRSCGLPAGTDFDTGVLYDWLTEHVATPPPGYSPSYPRKGLVTPDDYADASYFVGNLLAYAGYTDRRTIAADLLGVLAGPAAEGASIHAPAAERDLFYSNALFDALHARDDFYVSTAVRDATRTEIMKILSDVLNHPQIRDARHDLEAMLVDNKTIAGNPYTSWSTKARGLATDFHDVRYVLNYALDAADTLLIPD